MDGSKDRETVWPTTGERFDVSSDPVHIPEMARDFFDSDDIFCLVASKGMGKTIFLKYKHYLVHERNKTPGVLVIPQSQELDLVSLPRNISRDWRANLQTIGEWADIWQISIILSLYLNRPDAQHDVGDHRWVMDTASFKLIGKDFAKKLTARIEDGVTFRDSPSQVLGQLLSMQSVSNYLSFKNELLPSLTRFFVDSFRSGAFVFIDSFDQSLAEVEVFSGDTTVWANGQIGLAKAAWQINKQNPHIKVFTSMRQEAYAQFTDEDRMAMHSAMLNIRLTHDDVHAMFDRLVAHYEARDSLEDLVGLSSVHPEGNAREEKAFNYIYRHTLGKPREFAVMGRQIRLSGLGKLKDVKSRQTSLRKIVNDTAAAEIHKSYLQGEMARFLDDLQSTERLEALFRLVPHAILTTDEMKRVEREFARTVYGSPNVQCFPFCELNNIGLLGHIERSHDGCEIQRFKQPFEFEVGRKDNLPNSRYYILHPALANRIRPEAKNCLGKIIIGDQTPWREDYDSVIDKQKVRLFISYCHANKKFVENFEERLLQSFDNLSVRIDAWRDVWRMKTGALIHEEMYEAIRESDFMIAVLSKQAVEAGHMRSEWLKMLQTETVEGKGIRLFPVAKDDVDTTLFPGLEIKSVTRLPTPEVGDILARYRKIVP